MDSISIDDIKSAPWNTRGKILPASVSELVLSISEQGLINPITLWRGADGELICIAGNRRLAALRIVAEQNAHLRELTDREYTVFEGTEHEAKMITVTENLQREDVGPLEEAALIGQCLDEGMTAESIAAKTGRPTSWVNRRRKLLALDDAWKARTDLTVDALEHIAAYSPEIQKNVAKAYTANAHTWKDLAYHFDRESVDLDTAKFDTSACRVCLKRTGVEADLFGVTDGKLGRCLDCKCLKAKRNAYENELIADATKGATEVVRVHYAWQLPGKDESSAKKTKKHPCAYVHVYDGDVMVRWGVSAKAKAEAKSKEEEQRKAEDAKRNEEMKRAKEVRDKLYENICGERDEDNNNYKDIKDNLESVLKRFSEMPKYTRDYILEALVSDLTEYRYNWTNVLKAFPWIAQLSGLSDEDVAYYIERNPYDEED